MLMDILYIVIGLVVGAIIGFLVARAVMKNYFKKNPPIDEKMIEMLMSGMGRKPSKKQVNQMMKQIKQSM